MDKGAGLSVGGISKIISSNKKITLRNWYSGVWFFYCLCLFMWPKGFPSDRSVCGKAFFCLQFASIREYWQPPSVLLQHSNPAPPQAKNRAKRNFPKHTGFQRILSVLGRSTNRYRSIHFCVDAWRHRRFFLSTLKVSS